jgi:hypothetical protein
MKVVNSKTTTRYPDRLRFARSSLRFRHLVSSSVLAHQKGSPVNFDRTSFLRASLC